jgi:N utilization substance protein A
VNLADVIEELVEERGLDRAIIGSIISEGMLAAYQKRYPNLALRVEYDKKSDQIVVEIEKTVVQTVSDEDMQISLKKARFIDKNLDVDQKVWMPFDGKIGRIEILRAKQIIASKIRKIEATAIYNEFKPKEGTVVNGMIHKSERGGVVVKMGDNLAFLPTSCSIPGDKMIVGFPIRALLKEVLPEPRNENQLILDRASELFLQRLFELEIPEIFEKLVEIKKVVRTAGYKSKIAVVSYDANIDPVGTCVGVSGSRIKPILKELGTEKVDVIVWSDNREALVKDALKPAEVNRVEIVDSVAQVWLDEDQRSLAIGKMGQNIALASRMTGLNIQLMQNTSIKDAEASGRFQADRDHDAGLD